MSIDLWRECSITCLMSMPARNIEVMHPRRRLCAAARCKRLAPYGYAGERGTALVVGFHKARNLAALHAAVHFPHLLMRVSGDFANYLTTQRSELVVI